MTCRRAVPEDLPALADMYRRIVDRMRLEGLEIWDDVYPAVCLPEDVAQGRMYVIAGPEGILAAFALNRESAGADRVVWWEGGATAMYLDRLGVEAGRQGRGIGRSALREAAAEARRQGASWLRLFVAAENSPAIRLYRKCGFIRAEGTYREVVDENFILTEYGYERPTDGRDDGNTENEPERMRSI